MNQRPVNTLTLLLSLVCQVTASNHPKEPSLIMIIWSRCIHCKK